MIYPSEISPMLASIKQDGKKWLIAPHTVVFYDGEGWNISEKWSMKDDGECIVWSKTMKDVVTEIKSIMYG